MNFNQTEFNSKSAFELCAKREKFNHRTLRPIAARFGTASRTAARQRDARRDGFRPDVFI